MTITTQAGSPGGSIEVNPRGLAWLGLAVVFGAALRRLLRGQRHLVVISSPIIIAASENHSP